MPNESRNENSSVTKDLPTQIQSEQDYQDLVREIADRVWKIWRDELRREQERHSARQRR